LYATSPQYGELREEGGPMESACEVLRNRIDASPDRCVTLSIDEIIEILALTAREDPRNLAWWFNLFRNPADPVRAGLIEGDLRCILNSDGGEVKSVEFVSEAPR
jgi:hypothetical protein